MAWAGLGESVAGCVWRRGCRETPKGLRAIDVPQHLESKEVSAQRSVNPVKHKNKLSVIFQHDAMLIEVAEIYR